MRFAGSPDHRNYPRKRRNNHIHERAHHEDLNRTVGRIAEPVEDEAETAVTKKKKEPADEAGRQQVSRRAQEPENGNGSQEAQHRGGGDVALHRKVLQERNMIGDNQPRRENQRQANSDVDTRSNRRVAEEMEPTITGQMRTDQHQVLGSQDARGKRTRIYGNGCVRSTATGEQGALSFPVRSTAVTEYQ